MIFQTPLPISYTYQSPKNGPNLEIHVWGPQKYIPF